MKYLAIFVLLSWIPWDGGKLVRSEREWFAALGSERFQTMRQKGTDQAFVGKYVYPLLEHGIYHCAGCDLPLFHTQDQYDAGSGFPSFKQVIAPKHVYYQKETHAPRQRYEILCRKCDSHLGHLFHDGPPSKYFRYCINSTALERK